MQLIFEVGKEELLLRGAPKNFEICRKVNRRDKESGRMKPEWVAEKWYNTLEGAFQSLLTMKLQACDANTVGGLKQEICKIRDELKGLYNTGFES